MTITRPEFPSPILVLDEFLPAKDAAKCLQECIDLRPVFMPASVGAGSQNRIDKSVRSNDVVMLDSVFAVAPERSNILTIVRKRIGETDCKQLWHKGDFIFDIINYASWNESVLSRYGKCDFYGKHQDTVRNADCLGQISRRLVTLVYYVNTEPERFTGGALTLFKDQLEITIHPRHNRAVVFPSFTFHKVAKVSLPEDEPWDNGRFSLNHWMGFREIR